MEEIFSAVLTLLVPARMTVEAMLEGILLVLVSAILAWVWAKLAWRSWRKWRARKLNRPIRVKVVSSVFSRQDDPDYPAAVSVEFAATGRTITYGCQFGGEEKALEFAAKYGVGTSHDVVPDFDHGVFVNEDFEPPPRTEMKDYTAVHWIVTIGLLVALVGTFGAVIFGRR